MPHYDTVALEAGVEAAVKAATRRPWWQIIWSWTLDQWKFGPKLSVHPGFPFYRSFRLGPLEICRYYGTDHTMSVYRCARLKREEVAPPA